MTINQGEDNRTVIFLSYTDFIDDRADGNFARVATTDRKAVDQINDLIIQKNNTVVIYDLAGEKVIDMSWKQYSIVRFDNSVYYITFKN